MSLSCNFHEAHYCNLQSQSNVYGLAKLCLPGGMHKILVASLRGKVISMEFQKTRPSSREVHFTYIPGDAEIVSIDAFTKSHGNGVVVGISFIKPTEGRPCQVLNIYSEWEQGSEYNLESISQGCQNIELSFIPYQLYHADLVHSSNNTETVFLLSGNDNRVHMFREDRVMHLFSEEAAEEYFPEFMDLPSSVTWMHCQSCQDFQRRLTAVGCQNGCVRFTLVNTETRAVLQKCEIQHDSPIVSVKLFTLQNEVECPHFLSQVLEPLEDASDIEQLPEFHLLVVSAIELTLVYRNVLEKGFSDPLILSDSDRFDCTMCSLVADVDMDGQNEILLGTYGQEMLAYKFQPRKSGVQRVLSVAVEDHFGTSTSPGPADGGEIADQKASVESTPSKTAQSEPSSKESSPHKEKLEALACPKDERATKRQPRLNDGSYQLLWQRSFSAPLLAMREVDITGDGVREVAVLSLRGLHILQHDLKDVSELCVQRLQEAALLQGRDEEDVFKQLLSENLT